MEAYRCVLDQGSSDKALAELEKSINEVHRQLRRQLHSWESQMQKIYVWTLDCGRLLNRKVTV